MARSFLNMFPEEDRTVEHIIDTLSIYCAADAPAIALILKWLGAEFEEITDGLIEISIDRLIHGKDVLSTEELTDILDNIASSALFGLIPTLLAIGNTSRFIAHEFGANDSVEEPDA